MTKLVKNVLLFTILSTVLLLFLVKSNLIVSSVNDSLDLFFSSVFPSLMPFFILIDVLNYFNYFASLSKILKFKFSDFILVSMVSGLPSNAKYLSTYIEKGLISKKDASILLGLSFFPNPMYVISVIGVMFFGNVYFGIKFLISLYLSSLIVFTLNYKRFKYVKVKKSRDNKEFVSMLSESIIKNCKNLVIIFGNILIFNIIVSLLNYVLPFDNSTISVINLIFEMSSGIKKASLLTIPINTKLIIASLGLSASGLSVISQALSILPEGSIDLKVLFKSKLLCLVFNFLIIYILVNFF